MYKLSFAGLELSGKYSELLPMQRVLKDNGIASTLWEVEYHVTQMPVNWEGDLSDSFFTGSLEDCKRVASLKNQLEDVFTGHFPDYRYVVNDGKNIIE